MKLSKAQQELVTDILGLLDKHVARAKEEIRDEVVRELLEQHRARKPARAARKAPQAAQAAPKRRGRPPKAEAPKNGQGEGETLA